MPLSHKQYNLEPANGRWYSAAVKVIVGLAESNGSLPLDLWLRSPAGWLPRTGISSRTLCSFRVWDYLDLNLPIPIPTVLMLLFITTPAGNPWETAAISPLLQPCKTLVWALSQTVQQTQLHSSEVEWSIICFCILAGTKHQHITPNTYSQEYLGKSIKQFCKQYSCNRYFILLRLSLACSLSVLMAIFQVNLG